MIDRTLLKSLYQPKNEPEIRHIPKLNYITIEGEGNPNGALFALNVEALYTISYAIKMSYKKPNPPLGYYEYKVNPLEGEWDLVDKTKPSTDKDNYKYKLMILQPDFVNHEVFTRFLQQVITKKDNPKLLNLKFETIEEGLVCQLLHIGPYEDEPTSFQRMLDYCQINQYERVYKGHKEIYLSDPRKADPLKMKTILRFKVKKIQ